MKHIMAEFSACEAEQDSAIWQEAGLEAWALDVAIGHGFSGIRQVSRHSEDGSVTLVLLAEGVAISFSTSPSPRLVLLDALVAASNTKLLAEARLLVGDVVKRFKPAKIVDREIDRPEPDSVVTKPEHTKTQVH